MNKLLISALAAASLSGCLMHEHREYTPGVYPVCKDEVISMTRAGQSDDRILERIHVNGVDHRASADEIVDMQGAGVSSRVLAGFTEAPVRAHRPAVETRTKYYYDPIDPAVTFGLGVVAGYLIWRHYR